MRVSGAALAALLTIAGLGVAVAAAPGSGDRDPSFSGDGRTLVDFGDGFYTELARDVFVTSRGKVVVVAEMRTDESSDDTRWGVSRLRRDGSPDNSFSGNGRAITRMGAEDVPWVVVPMGDGAVLVGGRSDGSSALVAYRSDGALEQSFGTDGIAVDDLVEGSEKITDLQVQGDGSILAAGITATGGLVARYLSDGSLDEEFGHGGVVLTDAMFEGFAWTTRAVLQPDDRLLVVGRALAEGFPRPWGVARFDETGAPDETFGGGDGLVETSFANDYCCDVNTPTDLVVQPDGGIVVVGGSYGFEFDLEYLTMARYTSAGLIDEEFGDAGKRILGLGFYTAGQAVALTQGGKIVVAGTSSWSYDPMLVARFLPDGQNDPEFGDNGLRTVYFPHKRSTAAYALAVRDGRIVVAGTSPTTGDGPQQRRVPVIRLFS